MQGSSTRLWTTYGWTIRGRWARCPVYGAVDKPMEDYLAGKVHYRDSMVPGAWVPDERLKVMDEEGIDIALFYPSLGLDWGEFQ